MEDKFYAVVNESEAIFRIGFGDELCPATIFTSESDAYQCLVRFGNKNYRVIEIAVFKKGEAKND